MDGSVPLNAAPRPTTAAVDGTPVDVLESLARGASAQMGAENFPVALRLLPARPRRHLQRAYGFARFVDDVGDEAPGDRLALLDLVETDVRALWDGSAALSPVRALRPLVEECGVPMQPFLDLVEANRVDQTTTAYETFDDLLRYCRLSATPIGLIVLHVAGRAGGREVAASDAVCSALQVLEHCQDVGEDAARGRVYLPMADVRSANIRLDELLSRETGGSLRGVVRMQVDRARRLLAEGDGLVRRLPGWSRVAVAGYVAGGLATADALRDARFDVLGGHVGPTRTRTARHALRLLAGRRPVRDRPGTGPRGA